MQFWSGDHLAIEVSGPGGASEVVVRQPYALVGALARADVRVAGDGVQKREALLYALDGKIMCRRLEAALPEAYCEVPQGEWLPLGKHRLRARIVHTGDAGPALELDAKPRIPVLRVRHKARASVNRRLYKTIETVGRAGDCELELPCPKASLYHCVLLREGNRLWCIDLGSGNGTLLNGQRIECALVKIGNRLRVGDFEMEFQRYSRRSSASGSADNPAGSNLTLTAPPVREDRLVDFVSRDDVDVPPGESIFGSKIINSVATLHGPASSLSAVAGLPAPPSEELQLLQEKQAEMLAAQAELLSKLEALSAENDQLRANQERLSQQFSQRLEEQKTTLAEEYQQRRRAERETLTSDLMRHVEELNGSTANELSAQLESLKQSLEQQWISHQMESHESALRDQATHAESLRQALSQEFSSRLEEWSRSHADELSMRAGSLQQTVTQDLQQRLEALVKDQAEHLIAESRAQRDAIAKELAQRLNELAASQTQQLKLQSDAQRHALTQELTRRLDAALEGRLQQPAASSEPQQQVVAQQWLQRLDELRSAQSDEIALAVNTQTHALSERLVQQLEELRRA